MDISLFVMCGLKKRFSEPKEFIIYTQEKYTSSKLQTKAIDQYVECCSKFVQS